MADRFRLVYLKSPGLEELDFNVSFSSRDDRRIISQPSPLPEYDLPKTFSSETILKQARADLKHPDPKVRVLATKYYLEKSYPSIPLSLLQEFLSDQEPEVRAEALRYLIKFRGPIVSPLLKKHLWSYELGEALPASPAVAGGKVVIDSEDGKVYCFGEKR